MRRVSRSPVRERLPGVMSEPFEWVVAEYGPMVLRVCRATLGPADAEEAWSETFLAALRAYPRLDDDANTEAWLVTIAHRKAIDITRATARRAPSARELPDQAGNSGSASEFQPELWDALAALPRKQRLSVAYHYVAGLPYAEIAQICGGSTAAARRAAADGIRTLRTRLDIGHAIVLGKGVAE